MSVIECLSSTLYFSRYPKNLPWLLWGGSRKPLWHQTWAPPRAPPPSLYCTGTENQSKTINRFWIGWCSQRQKPKRWTLGKSWNTFVFLLIFWAKGFPFLWRVEANSTSRQLVLESKELWDQFHVIGTEMIVTKAGRYVWKNWKFLNLRLENSDICYHISTFCLCCPMIYSQDLANVDHAFLSNPCFIAKRHNKQVTWLVWTYFRQSLVLIPP